MSRILFLCLALPVVAALDSYSPVGTSQTPFYGTFQFATYQTYDACKTALTGGPLTSKSYPADNTCVNDPAWPPAFYGPLNQGLTLAGSILNPPAKKIPENGPWPVYTGLTGSLQGYCEDSWIPETNNYYADTDRFSGTFYVNGFDAAQDVLGAAVAKQCGVSTSVQRTTPYNSLVVPSVASFTMEKVRSGTCYELKEPTSKTGTGLTEGMFAGGPQTIVTCTTAAGATCTAVNGNSPKDAAGVFCTCAAGTSVVTTGKGAALGYIAVTCTRKTSSTCFPADATVQLQDDSIVRMDELAIGQSVRVSPKEHSEVFMFSHKYTDAVATFVELKTVSGSIKLTPEHYIYVNGKAVPAGSVKVGDNLETKDGKSATVTGVATVRATGLYNPHTMNGDIVVNGFRTTTYTETISPALAHAMLAPVRALYAMNVTFA